MYSTAMVQAITREPKDNSFIGPDLKYRSVVLDTLKILTFDTTLVQDAIKNLVYKGEKFFGNIFMGKYLDCGTISGYIQSGIKIFKGQK